MKIINNNDCYVQGEDIEYIANHIPGVDNGIKMELQKIVCKPQEFIKIDNPKVAEYIKNTPLIPLFELLYILPFDTLERLLLELKIELQDIDLEEAVYSSKSDRIVYREKRNNRRKNKQYLINQLIEMIEYKKGKSKVEYPNVPNPCLEGIKSEGLIANLSIKYGNVLISKENGSSISLKDNPEFYEVAYKLYMHDTYTDGIDSVEIEQELSKDGKYVSVKGINYIKEENTKLERKL